MTVANEHPPYAFVPPRGFTLKRCDTLQRTVRYEWPGANGRVYASPAFYATVQEWERALD